MKGGIDMANANETSRSEASRQKGPPEPGRNGAGKTTGRASGGRREAESSTQPGSQNRAMSRRSERQELTRGGVNPFESLWQLSRDMDRLMASVFSGSFAPAFGSVRS